MPEHYPTIDDLPVFNWWRIHEEGDCRWLLINKDLPKGRRGRSARTVLSAVFKKMCSEFVKRFGLGNDFMRQLEKQKQIYLLKIERHVTGDKSIETLIKIKQIQLDLMKGSQPSMGFYEIKGILEQHLGFCIDAKRVSVAEFYSYFKIISSRGRQR